MAGHSHWAQIKRKKAVMDAKRSQLISKLINAIIIAAREGTNPETNPKLRNAIERAKEFKVPMENIERAISKSEEKDLNLEEVIYEAYFKEGVSLLIRAITDNKNRTLGEIKHLFNKHEVKMAEPGSVIWGFEEKGVIEIKKEDWSKIENLLDLIENFEEKEDRIMLITSVKTLNDLRNKLSELGIEILDARIEFLPLNPIENLSEETKNKLKDFIDDVLELDDVEEVYSNVKNLDF